MLATTHERPEMERDMWGIVYEFHYILSILLPLCDASVKILAVDIILPFIVTAQQRSKHRLLGLILRESVRIDNWVLL